MITVFNRNGELYKFASQKMAEAWIRDNGSEYDYNTENLTVMCDVIPEDAPVIIDSILHIVMCNNCTLMMKTTTNSTEILDYLICPRCSCRTKI